MQQQMQQQRPKADPCEMTTKKAKARRLKGNGKDEVFEWGNGEVLIGGVLDSTHPHLSESEYAFASHDMCFGFDDELRCGGGAIGFE